MFEGAPLKHFEHTKTFFAQHVFNLFFTFVKNAFVTNSRFVSQNVHVIKKKGILDRKVFKLQCFSKVFANVGGNALFWRGH